MGYGVPYSGQRGGVHPELRRWNGSRLCVKGTHIADSHSYADGNGYAHRNTQSDRDTDNDTDSHCDTWHNSAATPNSAPAA